MNPGLLTGVRILAIEQFGAGPFGTLHLADLGAEVIKIENPHDGGDIARRIPPYTIPDDSLYFQSFNRNKRSLTLDLKHPAGRKIFHELVRQADAVFNNLRGDQPQVLGLTHAQLKAINPKIVCCSLSGFGLDGPRHAEPAYDYLMQAYAGWMSLTGEPDAPPTKSGLSVVDYAGGVIAMLGIMAGLFNAQRTGEGCDVDVSLLDTAVNMLNYVASWALNRDYEPKRMANSAHPTLVPAQAFQTKDGYLVIFCAKEKFWRALVTEMDGTAMDGTATHGAATHSAAMDTLALADDPRYTSFPDRYAHRAHLLSELATRFQNRTTEEWLSRLRGKVPCAPVNNLAQALADEQVLARGMVLDVDHPEYGALKQVRTAIHIAGQGVGRAPGPALGADTDQILQTLLNYSDESIAELRASSVI